MTNETEPTSFSNWLKNPQTLVGLSALLLSLCGLFIAVYEASLFRQAQRASVWPHVEVAASMTPAAIKLWVENTGVGPARIQAAAVTHEGKTLANWTELLHQVTGEAPTEYDYYYSLINGRVLPTNEPETIFAVADSSGSHAAAAMMQLREGVLAGTVDVAVCYCSVYDECWTSSLQDLLRRSRGKAALRETRVVANCEAAPQSGI